MENRLVCNCGCADFGRIVAHSMGSQILLRSIDSLRPAFDHRLGFNNNRRVRLGHVIFANPDVSASVFETKVANLAPFAQRVTIYASANDGVLTVSKTFRGNVPRAGQIEQYRPVFIIENQTVEVVDITGAPISLFNPDRYFGKYHSAFTHPAVVEDIKTLFTNTDTDEDNPSPGERAKTMDRPDNFIEMDYSINGRKGKFWKLLGERTN